jgi:hypothetical protein
VNSVTFERYFKKSINLIGFLHPLNPTDTYRSNAVLEREKEEWERLYKEKAHAHTHTHT